MTIDYVRKVLAARVYDVATETTLEFAPILSKRTGNRIYFKREDRQSVYSFKLRGAYNKMASLTPHQVKRGVICASAGNHAQGVAVSAVRLGCHATIVLPTTASQLKIDAIKAHGGGNVTVMLQGDSFTDACQHAMALEQTRELSFVHPFDDPDVIAGQGTIGMEILRQHPASIGAIFVPVGGGGLLAGVAAYVKQIRPEIRIIGVQALDSDAMARSLQAGERVSLAQVGLFSDGTAVRLVGKEPFRLALQFVDEVVSVDSNAICAAIQDVFEDSRSVLEPAGALAIAGLKAYVQRAAHNGQPVRGQTLIAIASGANIDFRQLSRVIDRAGQADQREARFTVATPGPSGSVRRFGTLPGPAAIPDAEISAA